MEMVTSFKYIGRVLTASDDDWPVVVANLRKAQKRWSRLSRILGRDGSDPKKFGKFYKAVVQETLLFGA